VTSSSPAIILSSVDFPQPDGPTSTMNSPSSMRRLTSSTAVTPFWNTFVTCVSSISANEPLLALGTSRQSIESLTLGWQDHFERSHRKWY
jgi:hypothetical protein